MSGIPTQLDRIEAKLDALIEALAGDDDLADETEPGLTLDGHACGRDRDQTKSLG